MKIRVFILLVFITAYCQGQPLQRTMLRIPDTGETQSYTTTFGEDNDYTIYPPFFQLNGNGTVTDTVTTLMWQQTDGGEMTIENATLYCDTLTLGGYNDWRLPTAHEAFSILNHQNANPALNTTAFTITAAEYWWTVDRQANDSSKVWVTNAGGGIGNHPKTETISAGGNKKFHVRAVRDVNVPIVLPNHFTDNGDGTITDHATDLIWEKLHYSDSLTWEDALTYADSLTLAGKSDWRLPNIKELQSINDEKLIAPSVDPAFFTNVGVNKFWSSTSLPNQTTKAWYLDTQFGITTYDFKTVKHYVLCVRGNTISTGIEAIPSLTANEIVFPNPFHDFLHVKNKKGGIIYRLENAIGQLIYEGSAIESQDFSGIPEGVYLLRTSSVDSLPLRLLKINY